MAAAPAYATGSNPCVPTTAFDQLAVGSTPAMLTFSNSDVTATVAYTSTGNGGDNTPGGTGTVARTTSTPQWNYLEIEMLSPLVLNDTVTVTITLTQAVQNLSFKIHDIDTVSGQWTDHVVVNTTGFTYVRGTNVTGVGTSADPFRSSVNGDNPISSGLGDVQLTWAGPISVVSFTYRAGATGNSNNQHIGLGNLSFYSCVNGQPAPVSAGNTAVMLGKFSPGIVRGSLVEGRDN